MEIVQGSRHIMFRLESEKITLITRRLEGEFLNYNQAIPSNNPIAVSVDRKKLISCIERCSLIITEQQKSPLRCTFGDGVLDIRTGRFTYVNAGHNPPLVSLGGGGYNWLKSRRGFVLAGMEDMHYKQQDITLAPGDSLFLYTDGVTEALNLSLIHI